MAANVLNTAYKRSNLFLLASLAQILMGYEKVLENLSWGSWKILQKLGFFVSKRVGALSVVAFAC